MKALKGREGLFCCISSQGLKEIFAKVFTNSSQAPERSQEIAFTSSPS